MNITLQDITVQYGAKPILERLSLNISEGRLISILGASGAGKTTLLRVIAGLIAPSEGKILFGDQDMTSLPAEKRNIGYVFQSPMLFPHLNLTENIRFGLDIQKWPEEKIRSRLAYLFHILQLDGLEKRMPAKISGGQQQRAAIARALASEPPVLLMDEPFSSLDPQLRLEMGNLIRKIQKELGITIVFVTHDRAESMELSHEIALMAEGRIVQVAPPGDLFYKPVSREVALYMGECNFIAGQVRSGRFYCWAGDFPAPGISDGAAEWLVRPHQAIIRSAEEICDPTSSPGRKFSVQDCRISGKEVRYLLSDGDTVLQADTFSNHYYPIESSVFISLPESDLHIIRRSYESV
ncbi:MAG: ABC transporter ATP-binding protein [Bacillota bacterium]|nr:ABC transporter ATP-binding protein [Bacillota bacterium]